VVVPTVLKKPGKLTAGRHPLHLWMEGTTVAKKAAKKKAAKKSVKKTAKKTAKKKAAKKK